MTDQSLAVRKNGNGASIEATINDNMNRLRELIVNGAKLTPEQIRGRADFAAQQHLDVISEVHTLVTKEGKTMAHTMSINGLRRKNQELMPPGDTIDIQFVEWPQERMKKEWAYAYDCYLRDGESYRQWQARILAVGKTLKEVLDHVTYETLVQACGPAPVVTGTGIVYMGELNEWKDRNFNPMERAKKRAEVNARHHRFPTNVPVFDGDGAAMEIVDGTMVDVSVVEPEPVKLLPRSENTIMAELGYDAPPEQVDDMGEDTTGEVVEPDNPYADLDLLAQADSATAYWSLAKRIGTDRPTAQAIVKECGNNMSAAYEKLRKQAPPQ